jgi:hypothetical protein
MGAAALTGDATEMRQIFENRTKLAVGALGAAIVLGVGAYAITSAVTSPEKTGTQGSPEAASSVATGLVSPVKSPAAKSGAGTMMGPVAPTPSVESIPTSTAERLRRVQEDAQRNTVKVKRPLITPPDKPGEVTVTEHGGGEDGKLLRIVTARKDLTGYSELAWVADGGTRVGKAKCSQKFRLSNETEPKERPTLLVCWRTSAKKSVYTVAVNVNGRPSRPQSVSAIDKAWSQFG